MTKGTADKLARVIAAVQALPEDSQEAIVSELAALVSDFSEPQVTAAQRTEVKRRLALPRRHVPEARIREILRTYNRAL